MAMAAIAQSASWMTVSVTLKPPLETAKVTGAASIGGSQKSRVSAAMRPSSISTSETPSVATTMALGERSASGRKTLRARIMPVNAA